MLPLTPFAHTPKNRWVSEIHKSKKTRIDLDRPDLKVDSDGEFEDGKSVDSSLSGEDDTATVSSDESVKSVSTQDSDDQEVLDIEKLMLKATADAKSRLKNVVNASAERMKGDATEGIASRIGGFFKRRYNKWYDGHREKRLHPLYHEIADKVKKYNARLEQEFIEELQRNEKEVLLHALRMKKRRERSLMKKKTGRENMQKFDDLVSHRDAEMQRMEFNCINMQRWAGDNYDRDMEAMREGERQAKMAQSKAKEKAVQDEIKADSSIIKEDIAMTQELYRQMRMMGLKEGVNVKKKADAKDKKKPKLSRQAKEIYVELKPEAADSFKKWQPKHEAVKAQRENNIFTVNLVSLKFVKKMKCSRIGEKGALALAGDFVRGACPQLSELDLSYCQIQTRGFARVMHGIKIANLSGLSKLSVRGNDICPRAIDTLGMCLNLTIFENLKHLDLRDNELGDEGANKIISLALQGQLENFETIYLDNNMMHDAGFEALVIIFKAIQVEKCDKLKCISLTGNMVKPTTKAKHDPYPTYITI